MKKLIDAIFIAGCFYILAGCAVNATLPGDVKGEFEDLSKEYYESCEVSNSRVDYHTVVVTQVCYLPNRCEITKTKVSCVQNHATMDNESVTIQVNVLEPLTPEEAYPDMSGSSEDL